MVEIKDKYMCSGCGACRDICSVNAIQLIADDEGFLYPEVDIHKCVECNACNQSCPVLNKQKVEKDISAYAVQTKDENVRVNSSSGGVFTEIAQYVLGIGGIVFGAAFDENFKVIHIGIDNADDLEKLRGSKYVQSEIGETFVQAKKYLDEDRVVLFTGTPCQIAGLYSFLKRDYDNLYTQDIICHGVPSPLVWQKYIEYREKKAASKTQRTFFRHKKYGWKMFSVRFEFSNRTEYIQTLSEDLYMRSFLRNLSLRPSCYNCAFKERMRQSDLTLADFWRVDRVFPDFDDDKGTSLVIVNSEKGHQVLNALDNRIKLRETDFEEAIRYNSAMLRSAPPNTDREEFIRCVSKNGFESASKKYLALPLKTRIKRAMEKLTRRKK